METTRSDSSEPEQVAALRSRVAELETALAGRIAIEQAKGILAERHDLDEAEALELIRYAARSAGVTVRQLCSEIVPGAQSPGAILVGLARQQRWRAAGQRERAELHRERAREQRRACRPRGQGS